ncbi:MAG: cyclic nucleotide-binding protein [Flavobacterium sp.]|uniref:Crp/Fnr family transcriptional regulator n=1 Tax=unclassified Flavobacterium TaxID=196869 RepID=UPI000C5ED0FD|nr:MULTISPECIES: Crp/Fnr family transcriptional regulator [unclassified Flavobacterium]MBF01733.1 cyclic nucleotide-binding protein [Flavobacterium sp.]MCO6162381.1 Crp/Fnr family transcriptional regulator [Flavobacterium sp. NRK F7]|tara:strand:+ start:5084 stop:5659 length:576 start_codon:yes stop_codon:yes gene_type:complete
MAHSFYSHITKFTTLEEKEFETVLSFFKTIKANKKENLLTAGQLCKTHFFVLEGCLRKFFINSKGVEQTTEFAIENWWLTDNIAYERGLPTEFYIQAVENSVVLVIDKQLQDKLVLEHPKLERYFRFIYQRAFAASQMRIKYLYDFSKEEAYFQLCKNQPEFVQRVPQYLIASFLGFTPEYLSEIRNQKRS